MAIGRLAETVGAVSTTAPYDIAVAAPASTPNGVCVLIHQNASTADNITAVSYGTGAGAVLLTERRFQSEATEAGAVYLYWAAGVAFPSGAQTVRVSKTTAATNTRAVVCPMTVAASQQVAVDADSTGTSASVANPSWAMTTVAAATVCYEVIHSGLNAMTATPATNWVLISSEDIGNQGRGFAYRVAAAAGNQLPGWIASTADDYVGVSVAFKEAPLVTPPAPSEPPGQLMRSPRPIEQGQVAGPYAERVTQPSIFPGS